MATRLNRKNRFYILIFIILIVGIILLLLFSVKLTFSKGKGKIYEVSTNGVIFNEHSNIVDTSLGGTIELKWDGKYYFESADKSNYLGDFTLVYEKVTDKLKFYGDTYKVYTDGNVFISTETTDITDLTTPSLYKIKDREYLIVGSEIKTTDGSIVTNKFLRVSMDKQGNASLYNDAINVKTISPISLSFGEFIFDIANEKYTNGVETVDLKKVIGSTNKYKKPSTKQLEEYNEQVNFIEKYNNLVSNFTTYAKENNIIVSDSTTVTNNYIVANETGNSNTGNTAKNKTKYTKKVALRGTIAYPTYIDVTYMVTDPEDLYQVVYIIVDGIIDGEKVTKKILLDKYSTTYRILGLNTKSEYKITLGDIEVRNNELTGEQSLVENIEDVINVRTTRSVVNLVVNKISKGKAFVNVKMSEEFAISSGQIAILNGASIIDAVDLNIPECMSSKGCDTELSLSDSDVFTVKFINTFYGDKPIDIDSKIKFALSKQGS